MDVGNVAVIENDGTLLIEPNAFDLSGRRIVFSPDPAAPYRYYVAQQSAVLTVENGTSVPLSDDDSRIVYLPFPFQFYGKHYTAVYVNSDGNLTFNEPDTSSSDRDLARFAWGPPRIGPLFTDLDPVQGTVLYRFEADAILFVWKDVPQYGSPLPNTFRIKLFADGTIEFTYGSLVTAEEAIAGISPGTENGPITAIDLSAGSSTGSLSGVISETFSLQLKISETAIARKFYQNHPDDFGHLVVFLSFPFDLQGAYAYELPVHNDVQGIGLVPEDNRAQYGSHRLESFVMMGYLGGFPDDPRQAFLRTYNSLEVISHEVAHRWLAFPRLPDGPFDPFSLLKSSIKPGHWSLFFNADASLMEGNLILDRGPGYGNRRFLTSEVTSRLSNLDRYLMGFESAAEVLPMFFVKDPVEWPAWITYPTNTPIAFGGSRSDFTIQDIIAANGPRVPSVLQSPKVHRVAFILVNDPLHFSSATPAMIAKLQNLHDAWVPYFHELTGSRAFAVTAPQQSAMTTPSEIHFPFFEGDSTRYTGFAVSNWGSEPADVLFRAYNDEGSEIKDPPGIVNPRMITIPPGSQIAMIGEEIHGLSLSATRRGWVRATSTSSQVSGFFLAGDIAENYLDGAAAGNRTDTWLCFTRAHGGSGSLKNLIVVVNPGETFAHLSLTLMNPSGRQEGAAIDRTLPPHGRLAEDIRTLFPWISPGFAGYLILASDTGVIGYESLEGDASAFGLPAQPASTLTTFYSAQFASGPAGNIRYFTDLNLINTSEAERKVQVRLIRNDGSQAAGPVNQTLAGLEQLLIRGEQLFGIPDASYATEITEGTLVISADGPGIVGDVTFGDPSAARFMAGLPLDGTPADNMVFSQVAQGNPGAGGKSYWTGIAMYNPGQNDVVVTVDVYSQDGIRTATHTDILAKGRRLAATLPEIFPEFTHQIRGFVRITAAGGPIVAFQLFGETSMDFLAAVPPQIIMLQKPVQPHNGGR